MARPRKTISQINVVPLIDVMLVLLVVFMITAPFINPGQVALPSVGKTAKSPDRPLEVILSEDGSMTLRNRALGGIEYPASRGTLARTVTKILAGHPDQPVVIAADKNVRYEKVMEVMTALQEAQVSRIGLLARPVGR